MVGDIGLVNGAPSVHIHAVVIPEDEVRFYEESTAPLSDADRDRFLRLLDKPPEPSAALKRAAARRRHDA